MVIKYSLWGMMQVRVGWKIYIFWAGLNNDDDDDDKRRWKTSLMLLRVYGRITLTGILEEQDVSGMD
jgi:hypothetical protein